MNNNSNSQPEFNYRREIVAPLFAKINEGESCLIIGPANTGKTRLIDFIEQPEVKNYYLGPDAQSTFIVRVDCNRLVEYTSAGLYELIISALIENCERTDIDLKLPEQVYTLHEQIIKDKDGWLAFRYLEHLIRTITFGAKKRVCFLLDEFDEIFQMLPKSDVAHLRALRDENKLANYGLVYVLFTRQPLEELRDYNETESFYELFARATFGVTPYSPEDAQRMLQKLEERKGYINPSDWCNHIVNISGGHAGLILALFDLPEIPIQTGPINWLKYPSILDECRKLWFGMSQTEQRTLLRVVSNDHSLTDAETWLPALKGIIQRSNDMNWHIFSPIFAAYIQERISANSEPLTIDLKTRTIYVEGRAIKFRNLVFKMIAFLYEHANEVCSRESICAAVYDNIRNQEGVSDSSLDALVRDARRGLETTEEPRYLLTEHGVGFRLVTRIKRE